MKTIHLFSNAEWNILGNVSLNDCVSQIISYSVMPFSSCLQSFPEWGSFLMSQLFASGGQSIRASASASVLPVNIQDWFPLGLSGLISLQSKGLSRVFSSITVKCISFLALSLLYGPTLTSAWLLEKPYPWLYGAFLAKWCLFFLIRCLFVIAFLPRSKCLLISWL